MAKQAAVAQPPPPAPRMVELAEERDRLQAHFDEACIAAAEAGEDFLPWSAMQSGRQVGLSDQDIETHRVRMLRVVELRKQAGTPADLDASTAAASAAAEKLAKDAPALREEIETLERKVRDLEQAAADAERRRWLRVQAREGLREQAKRVPWLGDRFDRSRGRVFREFSKLPTMEARLRTITEVAALADPEMKLRHLDGASMVGNEKDHPEATRLAQAALRVMDVNRVRTTSVDEGSWSRYVEALKAEAEALAPEVETLRARRDEALIEPEAILDHYLP